VGGALSRGRRGIGRLTGGSGRVVLSCPRVVKTPTCAGRLSATGGGSTTFRLQPGERRVVRLHLARGRPRTAQIVVRVR